jgi:alpha-amylase/alpha-mannosidase (GH57 family)
MNVPNICIHGHFYQPPRENPWLETIELQESAHPYHNWNEKISAECYSQNSFSRILNPDKKIRKVMNNYSYISFNIGPTLIGWLKKFDPETYLAILEADKISQKRFSGHGSAIAQIYNHIIMPLASRRDKITQVKWGISDFILHFGRFPEGMWLSETAVDIETLEILAENNIKFVILAEHQAKAVKPLESETWYTLKPHEVDTTRPYLCKLPSGNQINVFLYNGSIAHAVGFGTLLNDGKAFAERLVQAGKDGKAERLVNIATDGETFGHHHKFGDMALAFALDYLETTKIGKITIYGEFLEKNPPQNEIQIHERSSWSCPHGVKRWYQNCGCNSGKQPGWNQKWREPLRLGLDWLRDEINTNLEKYVVPDFKDFWRARDEYIQVISTRNLIYIDSFMSSHLHDSSDKSKYSFYIQIMEIQRLLLLMYTSCGWFFDDIGSIETIQILRYSIRAIELYEKFYPEKLHNRFNELIGLGISNVPDKKDGMHLIKTDILPGKADSLRAGVHFVISLFYFGSLEKIEKYQYEIKSEFSEKLMLPGITLLFGKFYIKNTITEETDFLKYICYEKSKFDLKVFASLSMNNDEFDIFISDLKNIIFDRKLKKIPDLIESQFKESYSLRHVFKDTMVNLSNLILKSAMRELDYTRTSIFYHNLRTITYMSRNNINLPRNITGLMSSVFTNRILGILKQDSINIAQLNKYLKRAQKLNVQLYIDEIEYEASNKIYSLMQEVLYENETLGRLKKIEKLLDVLDKSFLELDIWKAQNLYFQITDLKLSGVEAMMASGDKTASEWIASFKRIGAILKASNNE